MLAAGLPNLDRSLSSNDIRGWEMEAADDETRELVVSGTGGGTFGARTDADAGISLLLGDDGVRVACYKKFIY